MDPIGRYRIVRELGRGAMGVVYLATDPNIGRAVAIKTIRLSEVHKPEERERLRERLFREARSAGNLSHPGIVTIYDVDQQGDLAYIAMEFVDGPTLDYVLSSEQAITPGQMFSVLGQTAAALDYAHSKGIVHRDIKPANIMIAADGATKVTDFGIAKVTTNEHLTVTGTILGTPHYMSPEQVQGLEVDGRSDQFSLAVIAYEMLTGEKPYTGEHLTTVVYKIVAEEPAAPHRLNLTLTGDIEGVLKKGMAKKPEGRYPSCQEFSMALETACAASPGWKTMARGGTLSGPTLVEDARAGVTLPPGRPVRLRESTVERSSAKKPGFWAFLMAILVATGLLALLGWQAAPWLGKTSNPQTAQSKQPPPETQQSAPSQQPPSQPEQPQASGSQPAATPPAPEQAATPAPSEPAAPQAAPPAPAGKPSPLPPADDGAEEKPATPQAAAAKPPEVRPATAAVTATYPVTVISNPGGATVTLDGRSQNACTAPCSLNAAPGRHSIAVTLPGYQVEHRDIDLSNSGTELPPIMLRPLGGTIMITSQPAGASILVNGKKLPQVTPAQVTLAPGTYNISVEKDGKQGTRAVDVRGDSMSYLKVTLE